MLKYHESGGIIVINPDRASVVDIDIDIESTKREQCIQALRNEYGADRVIKVATFKTEKARSAILTAGRALGMDVDTTRYIASLCKAPRGLPYNLTQMYYGDIEEELLPNAEFVKQMTLYPDLWEVAYAIEGLVTGLGAHAGGVIISENPIRETCGIMKTSGDDFVTSFDLHELEELSLIKIDGLATEGLSKIRTAMDLLIEYGYMEDQGSLKATYEKYLGVYSLDRESPEMWKMVHENKVISLFQMEQQSGIQGIALTKPTTLEDLATLNSVIRLQPPDKQSERPLEKFARFKEDRKEWDYEMEEYGLTPDEIEFLHDMFDYSSGIAAQQEDLYNLMTSERIVGYSFGRADVLRKAVAKKNPKEFKDFEEQFWKDVKEKGTSQQLAKYIWYEMVVPQAGYSFNLAHCLSYSLVALQEMNLAYHYPILFWNTANLIIDSGAVYNPDEDDDFENPIDCADNTCLIEEAKRKTVTSDYGKIASAIGRMQQNGISILPPDINKSKRVFTPIPEDDSIRYGITGIMRVGKIVDSIMENRPYTGVKDFLNKVKVNKPQMVNLIKAGAFDSFGDRQDIMREYILDISDTKKTLNLRNVAMLIRYGLLPGDSGLDFQVKVFNFNKYIRTGYDKSGYLKLDEIAMRFYEENFNMDVLTVDEEGNTMIKESIWKAEYDSRMDNIRQYIKNNLETLLNDLNNQLIRETKEKYAEGNLAKWSMDSVSFYQGAHELDGVDLSAWGVKDFWTLPEEPEVRNTFMSKQGHVVKMFHLHRIAGTVIDKDAMKSQVILLTPGGVVTVQAYGVMQAYDKQISELQTDGKKKVVERSWFTRGTKLIVNGMRRGDHTFVAKKYANDKGHHFYKIAEITEDGQAIIQEERVEVAE